jgi:hypothetical protein
MVWSEADLVKVLEVDCGCQSGFNVVWSEVEEEDVAWVCVAQI